MCKELKPYSLSVTAETLPAILGHFRGVPKPSCKTAGNFTKKSFSVFRLPSSVFRLQTSVFRFPSKICFIIGFYPFVLQTELPIFANLEKD